MNDATQKPEDANLENQEAKAPEAAEQAAETAPEAAPEVEPEVKAEPPAVEEPALSEPRELAKPAGDFDWDAFESEQDDYSAEERKRLEDLYEESLTLIKEKEVVEALNANSKYIRGQLSKMVSMKYLPNLKFTADFSFGEADHIETLLKSDHVAQDLAKDDIEWGIDGEKT